MEMEEIEGPFDHFWGPLNVIDFESSRPFFESQLIDNDEFKDVNYCSLESVFDHEPSNSSSTEVEYKGNIAERRLMNWEHGKISSPISSSPELSPVQSTYLTIPPGISPAALLESPVMLPNSQHSPTTGTFPMVACDDDNSVINSFNPQTDRDSDIVVDSFGMFMFKPPGDFATQMPCTSNTGHQPSTNSKVHAEATKRDSASCFNMEMSTENEIEDRTTSISDHVNLHSPPVDIVDHQEEPLLKECVKIETGIHLLFESEEKGIPASTKISNAGDGYYWRKYGQKHVKGSEYPRSYYKCNNSNCPVKKKVERSHEGEITEIIYNGGHNHPKPHPRLSLGSRAISSEILDSCEVLSGYPKLEGWTGRTCNQLMTPSASSDWTADGLERMPSAPVLNDICDPSSISQETPAALFGSSVKTPENANTIASQNGDDQDGIMQWSTSPSEDADGDESEPKRRKRDTFSSEAYLPSSRSIREPRIILQIESEIDVLDDGYRWRKYGQKVVKGNPNPRSYYKCTSAGCPVRKHVERASEDIKSVITTYEGKHNHEVPTTKKMGAPNVGQSPPNVSDSNAMLMLPNVSNVDMKVQDFPMHYQMKPAIRNELVQSSLLGDYVSDMKLGVSSIYQMKFPPLQSLPMPYSPFMMNSNGNEVHTSSFGTPLMHDLPMIGASRNTNMAVGSFHSNNYPRQGGVIQGSIGMQQIKESDFRFFKPKEEQKDDNSYNNSHDDEKLSSTTFCRAMGKFPT